MRRKILTTTLLSMTLLSLNLSAGSQMKCNGNVCIVNLSDNASVKQNVKGKQFKVKKLVVKKVPLIDNSYNTIVIDNIETIVFSQERYIMTEDEINEYELANNLDELLKPSLTEDGLPISKHFCEDNLKPVKVAGIANTFECA